MRVLIAEDENRSRRGLRDLLALISDECEIIGEAADGKKAFEMIKVLRPDVAFVDIKMPYMDGLTLIKAIKSQGIEIKFVIVSAYEEFNLAREACGLGVVDYLVKPLTMEDVEMVWEKLNQKKETHFPDKAGKSLRDNYVDIHPLVGKALDILQTGYATKISQKELAQQLGISAEYFSYLFSRDIGENFSRFLRHYRIEMAKELLDKKTLPVDEISYSVGFSDVKYFYKCFKEETGVTVTDYMRY